MDVSFRLFTDGDIQKIGKFLGNFGTELHNDRKVIWDYISQHPCFEMFHPEKMGIWEHEDEIVGIVRLECPWYGSVVIDVNPEYPDICKEMIQYAEKTYAGMDEDCTKYLKVNVREKDILLKSLTTNGYFKGEEGRMHSFSLLEPIPIIMIPEGFQLKSLKVIYSFEKLNELLWRAFNYKGEPPSFEDDVYLPLKHAWLEYQQDICIVVEAPDGSYASFCGMWYDNVTKSAFIEPLATSQKYRNLGLAKACIFESMKKLKALGAKIVFVEPDEKPLEWYQRIGFKPAYRSYCWSKYSLD